jgi:molecular chaperone GrpE
VKRGFTQTQQGKAWEYDMAANTMDGDVDPSATGESKDNDPSSEIASLRERLMRALAETENTRRQGERREQDARQYAITNFARELLQVVDNLRRAIGASTTPSASRSIPENTKR